MGLFTSTFTHTQTTTLPQLPASSPSPSTPQHTSDIPFQTALSLLYDPTTIISLNPLVTSIRELDPSPNHNNNSDNIITTTTTTTKPLTPQSTTQDPSSAAPPDSSPPQTPRNFCIQDTKPLFAGLYTAKITYHVSHRPAADLGCDTVVAASAGVSIRGSWRVHKVEGGGAGAGLDDSEEGEELHLVEKATITCPSVFAPFIRATLGKSHKEMHERFVGRWRDKCLDGQMTMRDG
jgi:hypothetical protein